MPTDHDPRYSYYYLPEDQQKFSGMMDAMQRTPLDKFPADTYHLNICVAKDGVSWEMLSNGAFFYLDDDGGFWAKIRNCMMRYYRCSERN